MKLPSYKFSPSILDKFQRYLDLDYEEFFYQDEYGAWHRNYNESSGEYHYSPEEVDALAKKDLIDTINRVPRVPNEPASKGTAFNECIDCLIHGKRSETMKTEKLYDDNMQVYAIRCFIDGFKFDFDLKMLQSISAELKGSMSQVYCQTDIETKYGVVQLYGYIDELIQDQVIDLKTTKSYSFGNYKKYWQRYVYPLCLIGSGDCTNISNFQFYVVVLKGGDTRNPVITGSVYKEDYTYSHEKSINVVTNHCERFIEFLEENRYLITDKKIFGGEKE